MSDRLTKQLEKMEKAYASYKKEYESDGVITKDEAAKLKSVSTKLKALRREVLARTDPGPLPLTEPQSVDPNAASGNGTAKRPASKDERCDDTPEFLKGSPNRTKKFDPGQHSIAPDPEMEKDPRILSYKWDPGKQGYKVTKYDPALVKIKDGRPMMGPIVKLDGHDTRLDDAIFILRGWAKARIGTVKRIEDTPYGSKYFLSSKHCRPVYALLLKCISHCDAADRLLKGKKEEASKQQLVAATKAYNESGIKLNSAKRNIENNTELAIGSLSAIKAAGEAAEVVLMLTGVGAAAESVGGWAAKKAGKEWIGTAAKLATGAAGKTLYSAADQVRDSLVFKPNDPVDWSKVGQGAAQSFFANLLSDSVSEGLLQGLRVAGGFEKVADIPKVKQFLAQLAGNLTSSMTTAAANAAVEAAARKQSRTPRQILARGLKKEESKALQLLKDAASTLANDLLSSAADTGVEDFIKAFRANGSSILKMIQKAALK